MIDTYETIDVGIENIEVIMHLADIHVRLTKRHDEYKECFDKVFAAAKKLPDKSIILVAGDILHSKVDLSPEAVQLASLFLRGLADIKPVILIAGNHDSLLTNKTRLDSLTPIVDNLSHKNIHYLKKSQLYAVGNILFNNMSVFDEVSRYVNINKITKKIKNEFYTKIALYHGGIHGSLTDMGYLIDNKIVPRDFFDGHDLVLLGDIHRAQTFYIEKILTLEDAEKFSKMPESDSWFVVDDIIKSTDTVTLRKKSSPTFRYPSSLIQQSHGETLLNHGFSVWNVKDRTFEHVEVQNDYGYFTIDIDDGKLITDISDMPTKPKLRVRCKESIATEVKRVIAEIRKTHEITDLVYLRMDTNDVQQQINAQTVANLNQISNVEYQNKLIQEYLKERYAEVMDKETLESICKINIELNKGLSRDDASKNIRWKPVKFEFSNMFSYGENNIIDFTKFSDVYGLFAANASGKSSLMDALCFTMFDKSSRAFKATHVMNSEKMSLHGKFTFEINSVYYVIERKGNRDKKNNVKVDVNFYKIDDKGEQVPLNAEARRSTNEIIRDYIGSYDDFVLTTLALQNSQGSFIDMGQTERKELLSQFVGLTLFDRLDSEASDHLKEISGATKAFNKEDNVRKLEGMKNEAATVEAKLLDLADQKEMSNKEKQTVEASIVTEEEKIVVLENVPTNIIPIQKEGVRVANEIAECQDSIKQIDAEILSLKDKLATVELAIDANKDVDLAEKNELYEAEIDKKREIDSNIDKLKTLVKEKIKKLEHLAQHKYDPNCVYCINNVFVKDAIATKGSLVENKVAANDLIELLRITNCKIAELEPFVTRYKENQQNKSDKNTLSTKLAKKELEKNQVSTEIKNGEKRVEELNALVQLYEKSKEVVETNKAAQVIIDKLKADLQKINSAQRVLNREYVDAYSRKVSLNDQSALVKEQIDAIEKAENEHASYEYYLKAIGRDGIPYQIISGLVPKIEEEVNNILSQIVEFSMAIETDGKNVNAYIKYEDRRWPVELGSGMEEFISGLALRIALTNISNLPRPNYLVIDEGFGALDADNMAMVHALFDYLKVNFDFIIVISHLDAMRDMVDKQLEIKKENGFSKIDNTV